MDPIKESMEDDGDEDDNDDIVPFGYNNVDCVPSEHSTMVECSEDKTAYSVYTNGNVPDVLESEAPVEARSKPAKRKAQEEPQDEQGWMQRRPGGSSGGGRIRIKGQRLQEDTSRIPGMPRT